jgi:magnesium transporter
MSHHKKNRNLDETPAYTGQFQTKTHIQVLKYSQHSCSEILPQTIDEIPALLDDDSVTWIRVFGMTDAAQIIRLIKHFGLSELDAKDILTTQHIMSIEEYDHNLFAVMPVIDRENGELQTEQLALIVGTHYLITIQESDKLLFETICCAIRSDEYQKFNHHQADFLAASIINEVISRYSDEVVQLENTLEDFEDKLLDIQQLHKDLNPLIQAKRREMIALRKLLIPFKDQLAKLLRVDQELIHSREIPYFKDIYDQLLYTLQSLESCREILSSLVDLYLNNNDVKMNLEMKQLTVVATIFIPLTFLVGVWGMNFKYMPELEWRYAYPISWGIMLLIGLLVWWYLKRKEN